MAALMDMERPAGSDPDQESVEAAVFHRKIEFHLARKSFNGFGNNNGNRGFKLVTLNPSAPESVKESGSGNKSERTERSETGMDPEISFTITFRRIGAGLRNLGNTCFLNSVLQCLTYTEPLAAYLQSGKHQNSCRMAGFCALCAIQKHVSRALQSTGRILEPKDLVSNLRCISRSFRNARQEDAHEYMVNLLECMHKCCLPSGVPTESPSAYEKSLVHKIFGGRLRSQVKCMQCSFCSNKFDPFLDLSLEIVKADSLGKALTHFTAKEQLDGGAKQYQCQQCKQKVRALKQLTVYDAPHVLTIHLKRFGSHIQGQKINKNVAFGPTLDLKPFVTGPYDGDLKYTLYGVLVHAGWSTHSGHYYCFVRTSSGMWYNLDDNQVVQVSEKQVLEQKAYMLFYVRDRSNFLPKKPVDVGHKENMMTNAIGNAVYSKFNLELKENSQNGSNEKRSNGTFSALSEKDSRPSPAPEKTLLEKGPCQNINGSRDASCLGLKKDPQLEPSSSLQPKKNLVGCLNATKNSDGHQAESGLAVEASGKTLNAGHAAKIVGCNNGFSVVQDLNASAIVLPDCNVPRDGHKKETTDVVALPYSGYSNIANKASCESADLPSSDSILNTPYREESNTDKMCRGRAMSVGTSTSSKKRSLEECQVGYTVDSRMEVNLQLLSDPPATTQRFSSAIAKSRRPQLKLKRKLFKCNVGGMVLSSNIIFGAAFCIRKRQKGRKTHAKHKKSSSPKCLLGGSDLTSDLGSSASGKSLPVITDHRPQSQREKVKYSSDDKDRNLSIPNNMGNGVMSNDCIGNELRKRVEPNSTMLSSEKPYATQTVGTSDDYRREKETGMMSILTRGLEETAVARWDGIDISLSEKAEPGVGKVQIGHIGDEWDEEYDRGKRKKIRISTIEFDGKNLFQEIATRKNAKRKGSKRNRSDSGNQPFRI